MFDNVLGWYRDGRRMGATNHRERTKRKVVVHDDGSKPGMCDLRIGDAEAPDVAIECVRAVDPVRAETWSVCPGRGTIHLSEVKGDWLITISRDARISKLRQRFGPFLRDLEERDVRRASLGFRGCRCRDSTSSFQRSDRR